jgi:predicted glycoside hydrolase/deacetylase ChbG (UPF0249 family)
MFLSIRRRKVLRLIANADDFGMTKGVTQGIIKSMKEGIIRDTSFLVNSPHFEETVKLAKEAGINGVGLHLTMTFGKPVSRISDVKTLVDDEGRFFRKPHLIPKSFSVTEVEKELRAQLDKFLSSGLELTHIDSHHHFHELIGDEVFDIVLSMAKEQHVPMRRADPQYMHKLDAGGVKTTDYINRDFCGSESAVTEDHLISILEDYKDKNCTLEIMCHPAVVDDELVQISSYSVNRRKEFQSLTSARVMDYIKDNGIELINFADL